VATAASSPSIALGLEKVLRSASTSVFTRDAKESAARARGTIVLVDGVLLTSLMMDHGVAVNHKALRISKVDNDYFEDV
jgi:restriction system protein